jgi:pimeloyl-ACP methyl ester carboxylesterase
MAYLNAHAEAGKAGSAQTADSPITIQRDSKTLVTRVVIEARGGWVAWSDVLIGLARAQGLDDSAFADLIPNVRFPLDFCTTRWGIRMWNQSLPRGIHVRIERDQKAKLVITLDRVALLVSKRRMQQRLRSLTTIAFPLVGLARPRQFGLKLEAGWHKAALDKPLVLVVPGFQANRDSTDALASAFRKEHFLAGAFHFPNGQAIEDSAQLLARELRRLAREQPERRVRLVAFSMGGLLARRVIEDPDLDPGNVGRLIMVATPNHGSKLACFGFGLELWEHLVESKERNPCQKFYQSIEDGLSEAAEDLQPDSVFLHKLNARPRNSKVRYSLLLGTGGKVPEAALQKLRRCCAAAAATNRLVRLFGPRLKDMLDLDEVLPGKGDGVVAVARGKLAGVNDMVLLDFDHLGIGTEPKTAAERRLRQEIVQRLKQD